MKVDFSQELFDLDGESLKRKKGETLVSATLRWACTEALMGVYQDEQSLEGEEKAKRYELAKKITVEQEPDLSVDDLSKLKKLVGKAFGPAIVGPVYKLLEGK